MEVLKNDCVSDTKDKDLGFELIVYTSEEGMQQNINPFDHDTAYTDIMKIQALKHVLDKEDFDDILGGAYREEEKSRVKEWIFSFRN